MLLDSNQNNIFDQQYNIQLAKLTVNNQQAVPLSIDTIQNTLLFMFDVKKTHNVRHSDTYELQLAPNHSENFQVTYISSLPNQPGYENCLSWDYFHVQITHNEEIYVRWQDTTTIQLNITN
jgi:hypothetical protein